MRARVFLLGCLASTVTAGLLAAGAQPTTPAVYAGTPARSVDALERIAAAAISLSRRVGPPTTRLRVSGSGFGPSEAIELRFDATPRASTATDASGSFADAELTVPPDARPGTHVISALGSKSGRTASKTFLVRTNWPQFRNSPRHSAVNRFENVLKPANVSGLTIAWTACTAGNIGASSPAVMAGRVYIGSRDRRLYAFDATTGAPLWSKLTTGQVESSPAVADGRVFVDSADGTLYAFDAVNGNLLWSKSLGLTGISSPAVVNGVVYVGSGFGSPGAGKLQAFTVTGDPLWSSVTIGGIQSSPAVAKGVGYVGSNDHKLYAFNAATGALLWSATTGDVVASSPTVEAGVVYVGSEDHRLYAFDAATGATLWSSLTGARVISSPTVANGVVYVGSKDHKLYAFKALDGSRLWRSRTGAVIQFSSPAVANGVVYIASFDGKTYAFDALTGAPLWNSTVISPTHIEASPTVANGTVYSIVHECGPAEGIAAYTLPGP